MSALQAQLEAAAEAFCRSPEELQHVLARLAQDVERATEEPLCIFPVMHHSPASALHMVRHLRERQPKLVLIEGCEDLRPLLPQLAECSLPVALQAYAPDPVGLPKSWAPLSVLTPITEFSAEFQAVTYALQTPGVELHLVDRTTDLVFQWTDPEERTDLPAHDDDPPPQSSAPERGQRSLELGQLVPSFRAFHDVLLDNARMSHFEEWSNLYIEEPTIAASTFSYRQVMFLIGCLFRRMGSTDHHRDEMRLRDRYMWTRIHAELDRSGIDPAEAVFVCGAAHACNDDVPEFGSAGARNAGFDIPAPTGTKFSYGVVPTSHSSIEAQFGHGSGAVGLARERWRKACRAQKVTPYALKVEPRKGAKKGKARSSSPAAMREPPAQLSLNMLLTEPPDLSEADSEELVRWCTGVVAEARRSRYLSTTADAIAIYQSAILLCRLRGRKRPSAYDFIDAAETCLEKGAVPGKRSVRQVCAKVLGTDRAGQVGYDAVPPLVRDVYDRLAPIGIDAETKGVKRVLMDFDKRPELRRVSALLWRLRRVLPDSRVARPIMGKLELGHVARQESWDVCLSGPEQRAVIELAYGALTVEQVVETRLNDDAFGADATSIAALDAAEASLILLDHARLSQTLGERACFLLVHERDASTAPDLFRRARRLVYHYRATGEPMPAWLSNLVVSGFDHYCNLLPEAFADRGTSPDQTAAVCAFLFVLESLALSLGCERSQVDIALGQAAPLTTDPEKLGLLWVCQWLVKQKDQHAVRDAFGAVLDHPIGRRAYPRYLSGLLHGVSFAPRAADLALEQLGRAFAELPDEVLLPWMPALLGVLSQHEGGGVRQLIKSARKALPERLEGIDSWMPPWRRARRPPAGHGGGDAAVPGGLRPVATLLRAHPQPLDAHARALGCELSWRELARRSDDSADDAPTAAGASEPARDVAELMAEHPAPASAWAHVLGVDDDGA